MISLDSLELLKEGMLSKQALGPMHLYKPWQIRRVKLYNSPKGPLLSYAKTNGEVRGVVKIDRQKALAVSKDQSGGKENAFIVSVLKFDVKTGDESIKVYGMILVSISPDDCKDLIDAINFIIKAFYSAPATLVVSHSYEAISSTFESAFSPDQFAIEDNPNDLGKHDIQQALEFIKDLASSKATSPTNSASLTISSVDKLSISSYSIKSNSSMTSFNASLMISSLNKLLNFSQYAMFVRVICLSILQFLVAFKSLSINADDFVDVYLAVLDVVSWLDKYIYVIYKHIESQSIQWNDVIQGIDTLSRSIRRCNQFLIRVVRMSRLGGSGDVTRLFLVGSDKETASDVLNDIKNNKRFISSKSYSLCAKISHETISDIYTKLSAELPVYLPDDQIVNYLSNQNIVNRSWLTTLSINLVDNSVNKLLVIAMPEGSGKSTFALSISDVFKQSEQLIGIYLYTFRDVTSYSIISMIKSISYQIAENLPNTRDHIRETCRMIDNNDLSIYQQFDRNIESLFDKLVIQPLKRFDDSSNGMKVIIIDGINEIDSNDSTIYPSITAINLLVKASKNLPDWIRFLVLIQSDSQVDKYISTDAAIRQSDSYINIAVDDARYFNDLKSYSANILRNRVENKDMQTAIEIITEKSNHTFTYLSMISSIIPQRSKWTIDDLSIYLPKGLNSVLNTSTNSMLLSLFQLLITSKEPLSIRSIKEILLFEDSTVLPLVKDLTSIFVLTGEGLTDDKRFICSNLAIINSAVSEVDRQGARQNVCNLLSQLLDKPSGSWPISGSYIYKYYIKHLLDADKRMECIGIVVRFAWMTHVIETKGILGLLNDMTAIYKKYVQIDDDSADDYLNNYKLIYLSIAQSQTTLLTMSSSVDVIRCLTLRLIGRLRDIESSSRDKSSVHVLVKDCLDYWNTNMRLFPAVYSLPLPGGPLDFTIPHHNRVSAIVELVDGHIVTGSSDKIVRVWNPNNGQLVKSFSGHTDSILCLSTHSKGWIVSGSMDNSIKIWSMNSDDCIYSLEEHTSYVTCLCVLSDGQLVSGSLDNNIKIWNIEQEDCVMTLQGHSSMVSSVCVLSDGRLASSSYDKTIRIWETKSGDCVACLEGHKREVTSLSLLIDGRIVSGSWDKAIRIWRVNEFNGVCEQIMTADTGGVLCLCVMSNNRVVTGCDDNMMRVWDINSYACERSIEGHAKRIVSLVSLSDSRVASVSYDNTLKLWNLTQTKGDHIIPAHKHSNAVRAILITNYGIISGSADNSIKIWNSTSGKCEKTLEGHKDEVLSLAMLPDGRLVSGSNDKSIKIWDLTAGVCDKSFIGHNGGVVSFTILSDGRLATGSLDKTIKVWNLQSGKCDKTFEGHTKRVSVVRVEGNGRLVSTSEDGTMKIWNIQTGRCEDSQPFDKNNPILTELDELELESYGFDDYVCACDEQGRIAVGTSDGDVCLFIPLHTV